MPTTRLGSSSHTATNDLLMKHFELDQRVSEFLAGVDYEAKLKLISRLPSVIDEINAETKMRQDELGGM